MDSVGKWKKVHLRGKLLLKVNSALAYSVNYSVQHISNQWTAIRDVAKFTFSDPRAGIRWLLIVDIRPWSTALAVLLTKRSRPCNQFSLVHLSACYTCWGRTAVCSLGCTGKAHWVLVNCKNLLLTSYVVFPERKPPEEALTRTMETAKGLSHFSLSVRESSRLANVTP